MDAATHHPVDDTIRQVKAQEAQKEAGRNDEPIPLPPGLREVQLSVEAAEEIEKIVENPDHPTHAGKEMPTADASVLLNKKP